MSPFQTNKDESETGAAEFFAAKAAGPEFKGFSKIPRLSRDMVITEKIDGTNGVIFIGGGTTGYDPEVFLVGSRTRWITPEADNHGFARWAYANKAELMKFGPGHHYGEWWGSGINRGYGLVKGEKRFSVFNTVRWSLAGQEPGRIQTGDPRQVKMQDVLPACVGLVPVLYRGPFSVQTVERVLADLARAGSHAVPGYMNPEGVVVFHTAGNFMFKKTLGSDGAKGESA